jgi:thiopurine S-methyltransferase
MDTTYWLKKWQQGDLGFHQAAIEPLLVKHFSRLTPGTVLVPLCGKSNDMLWLSQSGWRVVGVEASPIACKAFFTDNLLNYQIIAERSFQIFSSDQIIIYCGDFFEFESVCKTQFNAFYDRAALIALPEDLRWKYSKTLIQLFKKTPEQQSTFGLLVGLEYSKIDGNGPPFSVKREEIFKLFQDAFDITEVERERDNILPQLNPKFKGSSVTETAYILKIS